MPLSLLIMHLSLSNFVMMMPARHLRKTFPNSAFIRNAESFYWHRLSHCHSQSRMGASLWRAHHLSSCVDLGVLLQHARDWPLRTSFCYLCHTTSISIPITPQLVTDVLRVPRIEFPDYPSCERLRIVSKDELMSAFCERPSEWGERQFTYCLGFAKGPRFLNMVMTFALYPFSHYNSITESRARFLLSFLELLTIDFPSHFILSLIDVFQDLASCDKLIFPSAITRILCHFSVPSPAFDLFTYMCAIDAATVKHSEAQFRSQ